MRIHRPTGEIQAYKTLVNPGVRIPTDATKCHGITNEIIERGCARCKQFADVHPNGEVCEQWKPVPRFCDLAESIHRGFADADVAGYNIRYDIKLTSAELERCGRPPDWSGMRIIDSFRLWQLLEPRTLSDAVRYFLGREFTEAHDAAADIEATEHVLIAQLTKHERSSMLPVNIDELHELQFPRDPNWVDSEGKIVFIEGVACFGFGKHKGEPLYKHMDYVRWAYGKGGWSQEVKRIFDRALAGDFPQQT